MSKKTLKYTLVAGLALVVVVPVVAFSQAPATGPAFGRSPGPGAWFAPQPPGPVFAQRGGSAGARLERFTAELQGPRGRGPRRAGPRGARAQRGPGRGDVGRFDGGGRRLGAPRSTLASRALRRAEALGLSEDQRRQISEAQSANRRADIERRSAVQIAGLDLRELMRGDAPDIQAVEAKLRELAEHQIAAQTARLRLDESVREILTAEQIDELSELGSGTRRGRGAQRDRRRRR